MDRDAPRSSCRGTDRYIYGTCSPAAGVAAPPKTPDAVVTTPAAAPVVSPTGEVAAVPDAGSAPKNPGSLFTPGGSMGGSNTDINGRKKTN